VTIWNRCICGNCKRYDSDNNYCPLHGEVYEEDTCDDWKGDNEFTEEEQQEILEDIEAHRIMVEGEEIN